MKNTDYIIYYRASTEKQRDGLGLDAQKKAVQTFLQNHGGNVVDTVEEIVSGGAIDRKGFTKALYLAKETNSTLLVHRIDRLSRAGFMTIALLEQEGVNFIEADSPNDSPFSKNIKFLVAKEEKEKIQSRVKGALAEINTKISENGYHISKAGNKITSLGTPKNLTQSARENSIISRRKKALENVNNKKAFSVIELMVGRSLAVVADYLNANGFLSSRGKQFSPMTVSNLKRLYS
tara:strand:- start:11071 stop:11775 length:705 start_codon:yes stop_codon:yes gene_type:complete